MKKVFALVVFALLAFAPSAQAANFGRLFPGLPPENHATNQQIADLAQTMKEEFSPDQVDTPVPSMITFGGQFADHDITLDRQPTPTSTVDPTTLQNFRTPRFDLDSVYGGGPQASPELYQPDGKHLRIRSAHSIRDVPRGSNGGALIGDGRNDENKVISQLHLAFLLAHNKLIDQGNGFNLARKILTQHWQRILVDQYLPSVVGQARTNAALACAPNCPLYHPNGDPFMPVEFSVATFRFGHSEVRGAYKLNDFPVPDGQGGTEEQGPVSIFPGLNGGSDLRRQLRIDWFYFNPEISPPDDLEEVNFTRPIDTLISEPLFNLPIPGAEAEGSNVLVFRSLNRAKFYGLPSYEDTARAMGIQPVNVPDLGPGFPETPLLYGTLYESEVGGGNLLGPVGGKMVAQVFATLIAADPNSYLNDPVPVNPKIASRDKIPGKVSFTDLLIFAGRASQPTGDDD